MSFLPSMDAAHLQEKAIAYREINQNGQKGIVFSSYPLPPARFDAEKADVLILLPQGYPDVPPDMFFTLPWVRLKSGHFPKAADQAFNFENQTWQRWSRHNNEWRAGVDGIWTMLKRVDTALQTAAA
ncbi:MAG: E2/UBC family protein [Alphaproteobacteria bacterium]|nr:E2/UBC family protein [Alphaproteobacteria bacterium]